MTRFLPYLLAVMTLVAPAHAAQDGRIDVDHNGSGMAVLKRGDWVQIKYVTPKASLAAAGITRETRSLFDGYLAKDDKTRLEGEAVAFKKGCFPAKYAVAGIIDPVNGTIILDATNGAPVWGSGCDFTLSADSKHLHLEFIGEAAQVAELFPLPPPPAPVAIEAPTAADIAEIMTGDAAQPDLAAPAPLNPIPVTATLPAPSPTPLPLATPAPKVEPVAPVDPTPTKPKPTLDIDF